MDQSIMKAIMDCGKCKAFGSTHLHCITRWHPFVLMVADTVAKEEVGVDANKESESGVDLEIAMDPEIVGDPSTVALTGG